MSESYENAIAKMSEVSANTFWASETTDGIWDVQLAGDVIHCDIEANTVTKAVHRAVWHTKLDSILRDLVTCYTNNVPESEEVSHPARRGSFRACISQY